MNRKTPLMLGAQLKICLNLIYKLKTVHSSQQLKCFSLDVAQPLKRNKPKSTKQLVSIYSVLLKCQEKETNLKLK